LVIATHVQTINCSDAHKEELYIAAADHATPFGGLFR